MTKLNLKELRERFGVSSFSLGRDGLSLLDWIERAQECLETMGEAAERRNEFCEIDCDCYLCEAKQLLDELEE